MVWPQPERFKDFAKRYRAELKGNPALEELRALKGKVTLIYGARIPRSTTPLCWPRC